MEKVDQEEAANSPAYCMIWIYVVVLGFVAGYLRARSGGRSFQANLPGQIGLLFAAALLQATAFYFPLTRKVIPDWLASLILIGSQICMLIFIGLNRSQPGFLILGMGLALNILVIVANGGFMPVSPRVVTELFPESHGAAMVGERVGWSKDILLLPAETRLWWLSDRFLLPAWLPRRAAFSLGDIFIAVGIFWVLWTRGGRATGAFNSSKHAHLEVNDEKLAKCTFSQPA